MASSIRSSSIAPAETALELSVAEDRKHRLNQTCLRVASLTIAILVSSAVTCNAADNSTGTSLVTATTDSIMPHITPEMRTYSHTRYILYFVGVAYDCFVQLCLIGLRTFCLHESALRRPL